MICVITFQVDISMKNENVKPSNGFIVLQTPLQKVNTDTTCRFRK